MPFYSEYKIRKILRHRLVVIKSLDFFKASPGEETEEGVCFHGCLKLLVLQYMDSCVKLEGKKRWVIPYKVSLIIPYTV